MFKNIHKHEVASVGALTRLPHVSKLKCDEKCIRSQVQDWWIRARDFKPANGKK